MGRELKRVPLDFDWPLGKIWDGFVNPWYKMQSDCPADCGGGYAPQAKEFADQWYGNAPFDPAEYGAEPLRPDSPALLDAIRRKIEWNDELVRQGREPRNYHKQGVFGVEDAVAHEARRLHSHFQNQWCHHLIQADVDALVEAERLWDFTRIWSCDGGWQPKDPPYRPTAAEVNAWSLWGMGHDACNRGVCIEARCKREGVPYLCEVCRGDGHVWDSPEAEALCESWQEKEPPVGDAYQIWETVTEGSPISPPFATPEALADWMVENPRGVDKGTSRESWLAFIRGPGWAPSMMIQNGRSMTGVQAIPLE